MVLHQKEVINGNWMLMLSTNRAPIQLLSCFQSKKNVSRLSIFLRLTRIGRLMSIR